MLFGEHLAAVRSDVLDGASVANAVIGTLTMPGGPVQCYDDLLQGTENAEVAKDVAQHIAAFAPKFLSREDIPAEALENERRIAEATAREEGKPEAALPRIVEGRVTGFVKENSVLEQAFAKDSKKTVQKVLDEAGVKLVRFARFRVGA